MKLRITFSALLLLAFLLTGCNQADRNRQATFYVFGTVVTVDLWGTDEHSANVAFQALNQRFQAMHRDWHAWEPGLLTDINRAFRAGEAVKADADIVTMVRRSQEIEDLSGGRFNPAIGALIGLWGFHTSTYPILSPPPAAADIDELVAAHPSSKDIRIDGLILSSDNPAVQLDFGGIAKGYAIDIACDLLRERGIENAIVNAGGDLRVFGQHGERPWRIAVRAPGGGVVGSLEAGRDEAIFTSGNYERFLLDRQERYPHILDPRTGWPVRDIASVTVIAGDGLLADSAATALIVAGLDDWPAVARALGLDQVLVVDESGRVFMTPGMATRITLAEDTESKVVPL